MSSWPCTSCGRREPANSEKRDAGGARVIRFNRARSHFSARREARIPRAVQHRLMEPYIRPRRDDAGNPREGGAHAQTC
jgi:hypothetical protein